MRALAALFLAVLASSAHADILCHTVSVPTAAPNWTSTVVVPSFAPSAGILTSVRVTLTANAFSDVRLESLDPQPSATQVALASDVSLARPNFSLLTSSNAAFAQVYFLSAYDGTLDFGGSSGVTAPAVNLSGLTTVVLDGASDLALFTGPTVGSSTIALPISASFASSISGPASLTTAVTAATGANVTVCYEYVPYVVDSVCHSGTRPTTITNWQSVLSIPRFDPALGQLQSVEFALTAPVQGTIGVEVPLQFPMSVQSTYDVSLTLVRPDFSPIANLSSSGNFNDNLAAFDGTIDFAGPSGILHTINANPSTNVSLNGPSDLALFTGPTGTPGFVGLTASASSIFFATGPGPIVTNSNLSAGLSWTVCYRYVPVAVPYCFGDGSGSACPCANESAVGDRAGCRHSGGTGARMSGVGLASLANDTLTLTCSGMPTTSVALLFQGTQIAGAGDGIIFGDGLRCASGFTVRLSVETAVAGVVVYPQGAEPAVSVKGSVLAASPRTYQAWYRDSAAFCTPATFNLSSAVAVAWTP